MLAVYVTQGTGLNVLTRPVLPSYQNWNYNDNIIYKQYYVGVKLSVITFIHCFIMQDHLQLLKYIIDISSKVNYYNIENYWCMLYMVETWLALPLTFHKPTVWTVVSQMKSEVAFSISTFTSVSIVILYRRRRFKLQAMICWSFFAR